MELALSVLGRMASRQICLELAGLGAGIYRGLGISGSFLVHSYLDRCGVAEVA